MWKATGLALVLAVGSAHAETCREDVEQRLDVLADAFDDQVRGLQIWSVSWGSIYAATGITQLAVVSSLGRFDTARPDLIVGIISSFFGAATLYLLPVRLTAPLQRVRRKWDAPDRCALLAEAEATREKVAAEQELGKSWIGHAGNALFNIGLGLVLGLAWGHWKAGLISASLGTAIGAANLLTQPTKLGALKEAPRMQLIPIVSREISGVGLVVAF